MDPAPVVADPSSGDPSAATGPAVEATGPPPVVEGPVTLRFTTWSLLRGVLIVAVGLVALRVAVAASTVLWWLAIATAVAGAFHPAVTWLRRWMPAWAAILVVIVGVLAFAGLVGYRGVAELTAQLDVLRSNALAAARELQGSRQFGQVAGEFGLVDKATRFFDDLPAVMVGTGGGGDTATTVQTAASSGSALFAIATFAVLMLIFGSRFVHAGLSQIDDPALRGRIGDLVIRAYHGAYRYVWLMVARAVVVGIVGGLVCAAVGLETPTALGVAFAGLSLIPGLGILIAAIPVAIYATITSVPTGVVVLGAAVVGQALETSFVQRRIDRASVHVGPTATLVAALIGLQLYGLGGALVGLAVAVYGLAVLSHLTHAHDEVFTAVRQLVHDDAAAESDVEVAVPADGAPPADP